MNGSGAHMNGSGSHTVSPRQVEAINNEVSGILASAKTAIEAATNAFLEKTRNEWEDEEAVAMETSVYAKLGEIITGLGDAGSSISQGICDMANKYAQAGGKRLALSPRRIKFSSGIKKMLKETFDGDRFGINDENSLNKVTDSYNTELKPKIQKILDELPIKLSKTNAFGNTEVLASLTAAGSGLREAALKSLDLVTKDVNERTDNARRRYQAVSGGANSIRGGSNFAG